MTRQSFKLITDAISQLTFYVSHFRKHSFHTCRSNEKNQHQLNEQKYKWLSFIPICFNKLHWKGRKIIDILKFTTIISHIFHKYIKLLTIKSIQIISCILKRIRSGKFKYLFLVERSESIFWELGHKQAMHLSNSILTSSKRLLSSWSCRSITAMNTSTQKWWRYRGVKQIRSGRVRIRVSWFRVSHPQPEPDPFKLSGWKTQPEPDNFGFGSIR